MMVRVFPYAGVQFMVFDLLKTKFSNEVGGMTPGKSLIAGSTAGLTSTVVTYPLDLARARLAVSKGSGWGGLKIVMKGIMEKDGVRGMYRGIIPTVTGMVPYAGLAFTSNDLGRKFLAKRYGGMGEVTTTEKLVCGGVSGLVAQSAVYPLDVTRRRMQTKGLVKGQGEVRGREGRLESQRQ